MDRGTIVKAPKLQVVSTTERYRSLLLEYGRERQVLEVGCASGGATVRLAGVATQVVAVDKSITVVRQLQDRLSEAENVTVELLDGRDLSRLSESMSTPEVIGIDIGGDMQVGNVVSLLRLHLKHFSPEFVVVKSSELATVISLVTELEFCSDCKLFASLAGKAGLSKDELLEDLSQSFVKNNRSFGEKLEKGKEPVLRDKGNARVRRVTRT